ncbi:MAG: hypothetical protein ACYTGH_08650, partial [Planctomycetota bacterium]
MNRRVGSGVVAILLGLTLALHAATPKMKQVRVAVVDLKAPTSVPWLGTAVREALAVKLAGVKGVELLERERMDTLLAAAKGREVTPQLLGVQVLLTGQVQVLGTFGTEAAQVQLSVKAVSAQTGVIDGDGTLLVRGRGATLFALETDLARKLCAAMGITPQAAQVEYREAQNLPACQRFAEGVCLVERARTHEAERIELLEQSIELLRAAQKGNDGSYYAGAHTWEGRARERLAQAQKDDAAAAKVREATILQFRADAGEAAPAFYDLAKAYQANGKVDEAAKAYRQYIRWMKDENKIIRWRDANNRAYQIAAPVYFGTNIPQVAACEYIAGSPNYFFDLDYGWLKVLDRRTHKQLWRGKRPGKSKWDAIAFHQINGNDEVVALLDNKHLTVFATPTGKVLANLEIPELQGGKDLNPYREVRTMVYLIPGAKGIGFVGVVRSSLKKGAKLRRLVAAVVDLETGDPAWVRSWEGKEGTLPRYHQGVFLFHLKNELLALKAATGEECSADFGKGAAQAVREHCQFLPDSAGEGYFVVPLEKLVSEKEWEKDRKAREKAKQRKQPMPKPPYQIHEDLTIRYLAGPKADLAECPATRIAGLRYWWRFLGTYQTLLWTFKGKDGDPWIGYDMESGKFTLRTEALPKRTGPAVEGRREIGGASFGKRMGIRHEKRRFLVYDLPRGGTAKKVFEFTHPWRVFSWPICYEDSCYVYASQTGMNSCDLVYVGIPMGGRGSVTEAVALDDLATCLDEAGRTDEAIKA